MSQTIQDLAKTVGEAKAEVETLRHAISSIPGELSEIERRLKYALNEDTMRVLIQQRAILQEAREIKPAALRGAEIRSLRAEAAYVRGLAKAAAPDLPAAVAADEEAKANLEVATQTAKLTGKRRGKIENAVWDLTASYQKLEREADTLEGL